MSNHIASEGGGSRLSLNPHDHTAIIRAIVRNAASIDPKVDRRELTPARGGQHVLRHALEVAGIDDATKFKIRLVLDGLPALEEAGKKASEADREAIAHVTKQVESQETLPDIVRVLKELESAGGAKVSAPGVREGLRVAVEILEDGKDTIYNPEFYKPILGQLGGAPSDLVPYDKKVGAIAKADAIGAVKGGLAGARAGGSAAPGEGLELGFIIGAVIGGVASSAKEAKNQTSGSGGSKTNK